MKSFFLVIIVFLAVSVWASSPVIDDHTTLMQKYDQEHPQKAKELIDEADPYFILMGEADSAIAKEDYGTAILRLKDMLLVDPENPSNPIVYSNLGMLYNFMDQDSLALDAYNHGLEMAPNMKTLLSNRALLKLKMNRDSEAYEDFERVIEKDSLNTLARYYHGLISLYGGNKDVAFDDFTVLENNDPDGDYTITALASYYSLIRNDQKAAHYFEKLVERDPCPENFSAFAGCLIELEDYTKAAEILAQALKEWPDDPELYYYRALLNKARYLVDDAKADAQRSLQLGINPARVADLLK